MKKLKLLFLISLLCVACSGCNPPWQNSDTGYQEDSAGENAENTQKNEAKVPGENELILAMNTPKTLNPLYNTQGNVEQALYLIFSPLINIEEDGSIVSNLAESWVSNEANTALTITLRKDLVWHDGTPLTSDDVIFTMNQIQAIPDCPYKVAVENVQTVERIDDSSFKIIYKQSFSGNLQTLFFPVIPKHIYNVEDSGSMSIAPIGSGPYQYDHTVPLESVELVANDHYFKGKPKIEKVKIKFIPDEESSLYAFKQGLIDLVYTHKTDWGKYTNNKANKAYEMVSSIYEFIGLNMNRGIFQNRNIRTALVYGLNREDLIRLYYLGHAVVTDSPISPISYLKDTALVTKTYDKEKAKFLLVQEGYQLDEETGMMMKEGQPLAFKLLVNNESMERMKVAKEIQKMYKEIGVSVEIEEVNQATYMQRISKREYETFLGAYQLAPALDLSFALHSSSIAKGTNYTGYRDAKMDELLQQAFVASPQTVHEAYNQLQQYLAEANPYVSLFFKKSVMMTKNKLAGPIKPTPLNIFANVESWYIS